MKPIPVYSVLLVSGSEKFTLTLRKLLPGETYEPVSTCRTCSQAQRLLVDRDFDLVIISAPLPDDFGNGLALRAAQETSAGVLFLVGAEHYPELSARLAPAGILTLAKPVTSRDLLQNVSLLAGFRNRMRRVEAKSNTMKDKMQEIRLVNKAKWLLIQHQNMTENQAHKYIEKTAMDQCVTRRQVAEDILARYEI